MTIKTNLTVHYPEELTENYIRTLSGPQLLELLGRIRPLAHQLQTQSRRAVTRYRHSHYKATIANTALRAQDEDTIVLKTALAMAENDILYRLGMEPQPDRERTEAILS